MPNCLSLHGRPQVGKIIKYHITMKKTLLILPLLLMAIATWAQVADKAAPLLNRFEQSSQKAARLEAANAFFSLIQEEGLTDEPLAFTNEVHRDTLAQQVYYWAAEHYNALQDYQKAAQYGERALPYCHAGNNRVAEADCLNLLGIVYFRMGDSPNAAKYAKLCNELDMKSGDPDAISSSLNTLAGIFLGANLPGEAEPYILRAMEYAKKAQNPARMAVLLGTASEVFHAKGDQEKALEYADQACQMEEQLGRKDKLAMRQVQKAEALVGLKRYDDALDVLRAALPQLQADQNYHSLAIACNKLGELSLWKKNFPDAQKYFGQAQQIFNAMGDRYNEVHSQLGLYMSLKNSDPKAALPHLERYNGLKDTLYAEHVADSIAMMSARLGNDALKAENEATKSQLRNYIVLGSIVVLALLLVCFLLWQNMRKRTAEFVRQFNELTEVLENQQEEHAYEQAQRAAPDEGEMSAGGVSDELEEHDGPQPADSSAGWNDQERAFMEKVNAIVSKQINEGHVDVEALASQLFMSTTTFRRRFTAIVKEGPKAYILRQRMEKARQMLEEHPEMNISEVAMRCGFEDRSNFTRAYRRAFGIAPSEFRALDN